MAWHNVGTMALFSENQSVALSIAGKEVALFHVEGELYAIDNCCTHAGVPLHEGKIEEKCVICPRHGAKFSLQSGDALSLPAFTGVSTYPLRVTADKIEIEIS